MPKGYCAIRKVAIKTTIRGLAAFGLARESPLLRAVEFVGEIFFGVTLQVSHPIGYSRRMINRRNFLRFTSIGGFLGVVGPSLIPPGETKELLEPADDAAWDWWREMPRTPVARPDDPMTNSLCRAAALRKDVTILYDGGSQPGVSRRIAPLGVFHVEGYLGTYVHAFCHNRGASRTFRVDRIQALV